ncbi:ATP-binding protein, partial [Mycolicibacterium vaccae]|nr:ATP-binding protein [Mycolicibacterium vaccae]
LSITLLLDLKSGVSVGRSARTASRERSADYAVDAALQRCNQALATGPAPLTYTVSKAEDLAGARRHGGRYGRLLGLSADRIADLKLVITELATNSLQHGGGRSRLAFWEHSGHLVCEVRDLGFRDRSAGRGAARPMTGGPGAVGLFVVNALADLVRTHTSPGGTTIHAYMRLDRFAPGAVTAD